MSFRTRFLFAGSQLQSQVEEGKRRNTSSSKRYLFWTSSGSTTSTSPDSESPVTSMLASSESLSFSPVRRGTAREGLRGQSSGTGHFTSGCDVANLSIWVIRPWRVEFGFSPQIFLAAVRSSATVAFRMKGKGCITFPGRTLDPTSKHLIRLTTYFETANWAHYFSR
jgi:hypothetical protein